MVIDETLSITIQKTPDTASAFYSGGRPDLSRSLLKQVLKGAPNDFEAMRGAGLAAYRQGFPEEALDYFFQALAVQPGDLSFRLNLIDFALKGGYLRKAAEILVMGLRIHPQNPDLLSLQRALFIREKLQRLPLAVMTSGDLKRTDLSQLQNDGELLFAFYLISALQAGGVLLNSKEPKVRLHLQGGAMLEDSNLSYNMIWLRTFPVRISRTGLKAFDQVFCQSPLFTEKLQKEGIRAQVLLGGMIPYSAEKPIPLSQDLVFVGHNHLPGGGKAIRDLCALGDRWLTRLKVWGAGWEEVLPSSCIAAVKWDYTKLAELYASSYVILEDHPEAMRREGFVNPSILEVMAAGGVVISNDLIGAEELFHGALLTYRTPEELDTLLTRLFDHADYRHEVREAGLKAVQPFSFERVAEQIIERLVEINEDLLDRRFKNHYMATVWAPDKGQLHTDRVRRLKLVTAEQCVGATLDVGCANGDSTALMGAHNPSIVPTGMELTVWGCREAARNHTDMHFIQGSGGNLPFHDGSFDTVVLDHVIEHFVDPVPLLLEARRVARQRVVVGIPIMHLNDPDHKMAWSVCDFRILMKGFFSRLELRGMREPDGLEVFDENQYNFVVGTGYLEGMNRKEIDLRPPLKLNLGCGLERKAGFINLDIVPSKAVDWLCDCRRLPFLAGSVERIELFHVIEHLPRHDGRKAFYEWNRLLVIGGEIVLECPDFETAVREYAAGNKFRINNIFGLQRHPGDFHFFGYTFESLKEALEEAGFGAVKRTTPTDYHAKDEPCMRVEALKVIKVIPPLNLVRDLISRTVNQYSKDLKESPHSAGEPNQG